MADEEVRTQPELPLPFPELAGDVPPMYSAVEMSLHVVLDTSYIRRAGFDNPDFRKLLEFSKQGRLRIYVPHIVWEERRTQLFDEARTKMLKVATEFEALKAMLPRNFILGGLPPPALTIWKTEEIEARSVEVMAAFAKENKIEIVPLGDDHGKRSWERFFAVEAPFNPAQSRENRRKHIPDAWILETALDLQAKHAGLLALCDDEELSNALSGAGIRVCKEAQQILDEIEPPVGAQAAEKREEAEEAKETAAAAKLADALAGSEPLNAALAGAAGQFWEAERKVLGYVSYIGTPTKEQLFELLARSGIGADRAKNAAERLAIAGLIRDTGHHYLIVNKEADEAAASLVETEIIKLLGEG